jgi:mycothiol synthase
MRVPLPLDGAVRAATPEVTVRSFRPGEDEASWLAVNNRAFAGHPEQGGWGLDDLVARERADWFDPAGFLIHEEEGRLAGSCWTKVHATADPPLGEIYVISVDPAFHQRGLGRALAVAGFTWLASTGIGTGMLYVDADNQAAMALYAGIGMTVHHRDRAYEVDVPAA